MPWWNVETLCRWMFFIPRHITRTILIQTLILLIKVIQWSSASSYSLVKITKVCVMWFLFKYQNKMIHPPYPLPPVISSFQDLFVSHARHIFFKSCHRLRRAHFFKRMKFKIAFIQNWITFGIRVSTNQRSALFLHLFNPSFPSVQIFPLRLLQTLPCNFPLN